ncbi:MULTISPECIES: LysR family transcriptional regulator [unclassified Herbaspirillum]|uniref:LysR family transcriptional regulator n=1 Tax=unclassified Herbaspirillum TaxID=2624150 RepID=UPI001152C7A7|nr:MULTISPECIES: LysR family transcriptional regulator [unclassified Herbaspirillum]MBB5392313.1 DNA-binding transcriptional LysR family regulator [Herbaspirillum sp. SJZ102]TQK05954.1 DNA-binding transcriptional LysR family regulator [Herbaspirillum sp. SJZ130]TQK12568.1 DNA-binding transcriptional LysR family regulator [Herbaspirillum sp. SJZ106]TWC68174.1 DNA-binding transcriptional LysR family regulator [Herbaspirillum sp. SJZ099]
MASFDLNLLPVALAIFEERSVSGAARKLDMSQPAVSVALNKLRLALGDPLFVRTAHGMEPTPRALTLISPTRDIMQRLHTDVLASETFNPASTTRRFAIALSDIGEMTFLPKLLDRLRRDAPLASILSLSMSPLELSAALENGEVDLAVGYFPDLKNRNFFQQRLFSHDFICLLSADHPHRSRKITIDQFLRMGHAVIKAEGRSQELFEQFLIRQKIQRRIVLSTPHFMSIPFLIASSDLIATVPRAVGESFAQFSNIKLVEPPFEIPSFDLRQHWHRKYHKDGGNAWLRAVIAEMFSA